MMLHQRSCSMPIACSTTQVLSRPPCRLARGRRGLMVTCTAAIDHPDIASFDSPSQNTAAKCPLGFGASAASSITRSKHSAEEISKLQGPGWSALPLGNINDLPSPQSKANWNPLQFVLGDFPELEKGEVPFMLERYKQFGPVFKWKLANHEFTSVLEHDTVRSLLTNADGKVMGFWSPPAIAAFNSAQATANMENPAGRMAQRKTLAPGFSRQALRKVLGKIERICGEHLQQWAHSGEAIDLATQGRELSFDFSTQLLVNFDVPDEQRAAVKAKLDAMFKGMRAPPVNFPGTRFYNGVKAKQSLVEDIKHIMANQTCGSDGSSAFELMAQALRESTQDGQLSDYAVAESGIGLLLAGTDTSGQGSTAALMMVALFPQVLEKLREEQEKVVAKHGSSFSLATLDDMPYAEGVIKEALRLAPPAAAAMRKTLVDLQIHDKFVPAGSLLWLSMLASQNFTDPSLKPLGLSTLSSQTLDSLSETWRQVDYNLLKSEFHPERWLKTDSEFAKSSGLMTFSVGPHLCLGMTLFMTEAKVLLGMLARGYDVRAERPDDLAFDVLMSAQLKSNAGSRVWFTERKHAIAAAAVAAGQRDFSR